jgi:DNA-binding MarR family transcriptional regulator
MSLFDRTMQRLRHHAIRKTSYKLTDLGKHKAEEMAAEGDRLAVLSTIDEEGAATIDEVASTTHISSFKVQLIINDFIRAGYVIRATSAME